MTTLKDTLANGGGSTSQGYTGPWTDASKTALDKLTGGFGKPPPGVDPTIGNAVAEIQALFPWMATIPGLIDQVRQWAAQPDATTDSLVADIRNSPQYKAALPGIFDDKGAMRMDESTYFSTRDQYKQLLQQYTRGTQEYDDPQDFAAFFENDMQPSDLAQRLQTYQSIEQGSAAVKSAFYVYAGVTPTDDDLYQAAVNPTAKQKLIDEYNQRVSLQPLDYQTWITRATQAGLNMVSQSLTNLQKQGLDTGDALTSIRNLDPDFAKQIADSLYHGGSATGPFLSLQQLLSSFQYAVIGGAASQSGLELPTQARLDALRTAGVTQDKAAQGYAYIAENQGQLQGALDRMNSGRQFSTQDYEKALFLSSAPEENLLTQAQAGDKALTQEGGGAATSQQQGRVAQQGLGRY